MDGYCEELQLAFEFQGGQHYDPNHYWNRGCYSTFQELQRRDRLKAELSGPCCHTCLNIEARIVPNVPGWDPECTSDFLQS